MLGLGLGLGLGLTLGLGLLRVRAEASLAVGELRVVELGARHIEAVPIGLVSGIGIGEGVLPRRKHSRPPPGYRRAYG